MSGLAVSDVGVSIAGRRLLEAVSLAVRGGEVVGLLGPNGSGKSTLLRTIYRALRPDAGAVRLDGDDVHRLPARVAARRMAAVVQEPEAAFDFTVAEIVRMGRTPHHAALGRLGSEDERVCASALTRLRVAGLASRPFRSLSGGEKQRVLCARALAQQPRVLILDEPTNHLDIRHQLELMALVRSLGVGVLAALHDLNLAAAYCDRVHVLDAGRVVAGGPPAAVLRGELILEVFGVRAETVVHPLTGAPQLVYAPPDPVAA